MCYIKLLLVDNLCNRRRLEVDRSNKFGIVNINLQNATIPSMTYKLAGLIRRGTKIRR